MEDYITPKERLDIPMPVNDNVKNKRFRINWFYVATTLFLSYVIFVLYYIGGE